MPALRGAGGSKRKSTGDSAQKSKRVKDEVTIQPGESTDEAELTVWSAKQQSDRFREWLPLSSTH